MSNKTQKTKHQHKNTNVNQDLNNFKILKISNSFYLKLDI